MRVFDEGMLTPGAAMWSSRPGATAVPRPRRKRTFASGRMASHWTKGVTACVHHADTDRPAPHRFFTAIGGMITPRRSCSSIGSSPQIHPSLASLRFQALSIHPLAEGGHDG